MFLYTAFFFAIELYNHFLKTIISMQKTYQAISIDITFYY